MTRDVGDALSCSVDPRIDESRKNGGARPDCGKGATTALRLALLLSALWTRRVGRGLALGQRPSSHMLPGHTYNETSGTR